MTRKLLLAGALCIAALNAQSPKFEVASVKHSPDPPPLRTIKIDGARVDIGGWSMEQLILRAYGIWSYQLSGPNWIQAERFDVLAKFPEGATREQIPTMLQALLAERFGLAVHKSTKDVTAFALTVAKGGTKMQAAAEAGETVDVGRMQDALWGYDPSFGLNSFTREGQQIHMAFSQLPMAALAQILASYLHEPVVDATGLHGAYHAQLDFSVLDDPAGSSLIASVKPLGLALERRKLPLPTVVVDHLEKTPKAN